MSPEGGPAEVWGGFCCSATSWPIQIIHWKTCSRPPLEVSPSQWVWELRARAQDWTAA